MIVDTMTPEEIVEEYKKIFREHNPAKLKVDTTKLKRYLIKNKNARNVFLKERIFKIDQTTNFYVVPFVLNRKMFETQGVGLFAFLTFVTSRGMTVLIQGYNNVHKYPEFGFYSSHFFDRYRERYLQDMKMKKIDVIMHFMKNNLQDYRHFFPREHENELRKFVCSCETGMAYGQFISEKIFVFKTFLNRDELSCNKAALLSCLDYLYEGEEGKSKAIMDEVFSSPEMLNELRSNEELRQMMLF